MTKRSGSGAASGECAPAPAIEAQPLDGSAILRREWRELARILLDGLIAGIVVSLTLALAVFIVTSPAAAATPSPVSCVADAGLRGHAAREVTYVVDTSAAMQGASIEQAREALRAELDLLRPGDRFNVIAFDTGTRSLFAAPVPLDDMTLARAMRFVARLRARGAPQMLPALEIALAGAREASIERQVVFITSGSVDDQEQVLQAARERVGDRRLVGVGIGPAPNSLFMRKLAQIGRGSYAANFGERQVRDGAPEVIEHTQG